MAKQTVAGMEFKFSAETASLLSGLERVRKETTKLRKTVDTSANRIKYAFNKIRRAAQVVASAYIFTAGIRSLGRLVTGIERAEDRMKLMQARFQQFARAPDAFTRVYNLSQKLGVSMEDTAGSMTRLLIATKSIGTAQEDIEKIQENIVILGRAGGTSAEEMKGALIQLSQGIASGRLAGEELRSVMENLPLVAMEIAEELDIGIGKLREYAAEGKVVDKVVVEALKNIGIALEDLPETFGMQTERMATEWDLFLAALGKAVESAGLLDALIEAVKWVRTEMLRDFAGIATTEIERQLLDAEAALLQMQSAMPELPVPGSAEDQDRMAQNPESVSSTVKNEQLISQKRLVEALREELQIRYKLEDIARKNAEVQDAAIQAKIDEQAEKGVARFLKTYETAEEEVVRKLEELNAWARLFPDKIPPEIYERIKSEIEKVLTEGIEQIDLQALKNNFKDAPDLVKYYDSIKAKTEEVNETAKQLGLTFTSAFEDALVAGEGLREILKGILDDIIRIIARMAVTEPLTNFFSTLFSSFGGGGAAAAASGGGGFNIGSVFGGMRAAGGPVMAGTSYLVGEKGPELYTPAMSGKIVPNHAIGGVTIQNTFNIDSRADREQLRAELGQVVATSVDSSVARVRQLSRRGQLL